MVKECRGIPCFLIPWQIERTRETEKRKRERERERGKVNGVIDWFGFNIAVKYRELASGDSFNNT